MELSKWLESNKIQSLPPEDKIFEFDETEQSEIRSAKPWERDPNYFKYCKIAHANYNLQTLLVIFM